MKYHLIPKFEGKVPGGPVVLTSLSTGVLKCPGTGLQSGGNVAGLLIRPWQFGLVDVQFVGQLLLAKAVLNGG